MMKAAFSPIIIAVLMLMTNAAQAGLFKSTHKVSFCETYEECDPWPSGGDSNDDGYDDFVEPEEDYPGPDSTDYPPV